MEEMKAVSSIHFGLTPGAAMRPPLVAWQIRARMVTTPCWKNLTSVSGESRRVVRDSACEGGPCRVYISSRSLLRSGSFQSVSTCAPFFAATQVMLQEVYCNLCASATDGTSEEAALGRAPLMCHRRRI